LQLQSAESGDLEDVLDKFDAPGDDDRPSSTSGGHVVHLKRDDVARRVRRRPRSATDSDNDVGALEGEGDRNDERQRAIRVHQPPKRRGR